MHFGRSLHQLVCLMVTLTLLVSSVGAVSFHNADNDDDVAFAQKQISHNTTITHTPKHHPRFHASMDGNYSHDDCNTLCDMMESMRTGFHSPEIDPAVVRFAVHAIPDDFPLYSRPFKPPR